MNKLVYLNLIVFSLMSCMTSNLKYYQKNITQQTVLGKVKNNQFIITETFELGSQELIAEIREGCKKKSHSKLFLGIKGHSDIPVKDAFLYRINEYNTIEYSLIPIGAVDVKGEICIPSKYLHDKGVLIEMVGFLNLVVKLED